MASLAQWVDGIRPRTLPIALAPVIAGIAAANHVDESPSWPAMIGALVVALALVAGVNYANDYSDGIRGTDDNRVGPQRLVGSGAASPGAVRTAAIIAFLIAAVAGVWLSLATHWWLILVGAVCILAAWFYTGGSRPYGYAGFGEIAVFV
ncbi:1,4-dihydroxy-2-naphthoate octaprenyltransferase, partial [Gordonia sp. UBA7599]